MSSQSERISATAEQVGNLLRRGHYFLELAEQHVDLDPTQAQVLIELARGYQDQAKTFASCARLLRGFL